MKNSTLMDFVKEIRPKLLLEDNVWNHGDCLSSFHHYNYVLRNDCHESFLKDTNDMQELHKSDLLQNAYFKDIQIPSKSIGNIEIGHVRSSFNTVFPTYPLKRDKKTNLRKAFYYYYGEPIEIPCFKINHLLWMSVTPSEIFTFQDFINKSYGNVVIHGCGMGYLAYMLSRKENINHITIVELDEKVIDLFTEFILPQFEQKRKVNIVHQDAFSYMEQSKMQNIDFCNMDIWRNYLDMVPLYLKGLQCASENKHIVFDYWIEESLKYELQTRILKILCGFPDKDLQDFLSYIARDLIKKHDISSKQAIQHLVELPNMRQDLLVWYMEHPEEFQILKKENDLQIIKEDNFARKRI